MTVTDLEWRAQSSAAVSAEVLLHLPSVTPEQIAGRVMRSRTRHVAEARMRAWVEARGERVSDAERFGHRVHIDAQIAAELEACEQGRPESATPEVRVAYGIGLDSARRAREYAVLEAATRAAVEGGGLAITGGSDAR